MEAHAAIYELEAEIVSRRKRNDQLKETVTALKGEAYELQRKAWQKQLQPRKAKTKKSKARETKKDKEEL